MTTYENECSLVREDLDDSSSSGTTDDLEDEQCRIIMDTMKAADGAANNVGTYKEMNKLAEMTMERILTQYSGK